MPEPVTTTTLKSASTSTTLASNEDLKKDVPEEIKKLNLNAKQEKELMKVIPKRNG